jgi:hypothetical protein
VVGIEADFDGVTGGKKSMTSTLPGAGYIISMFVFEFATWTGVLARHDPEPPPAHQSRQTLLESERGMAQKSSPSSSRRSKAYSVASLTVPRRCRAWKYLVSRRQRHDEWSAAVHENVGQVVTRFEIIASLRP